MNIIVMKKKNDSTVSVITELSNSNLNPDVKSQLIGQVINNGSEGEDGMLDKMFGKTHQEMYLIVLLCVLLLVIGLVNVYGPQNNDAKEYWNLIVPAFTLAMGYLVGKKKE